MRLKSLYIHTYTYLFIYLSSASVTRSSRDISKLYNLNRGHKIRENKTHWLQETVFSESKRTPRLLRSSLVQSTETTLQKTARVDCRSQASQLCQFSARLDVLSSLHTTRDHCPRTPKPFKISRHLSHITIEQR